MSASGPGWSGCSRGRGRADVHAAGTRAWSAFTGYVRGTVLVATFDAVFIGLALLLFRIPLVAPLAVLTFFAAFIPLAGATAAGAAAVLVALVANGPSAALLVLAAVIAVQQIEAHVLQPFLLGRAVELHPLAVVLAITAGAILAGIPGALVAVPLAAVVNAVGKYLAGRDGPPAEELGGQPASCARGSGRIDAGTTGEPDRSGTSTAGDAGEIRTSQADGESHRAHPAVPPHFARRRDVSVPVSEVSLTSDSEGRIRPPTPTTGAS